MAPDSASSPTVNGRPGATISCIDRSATAPISASSNSACSCCAGLWFKTRPRGATRSRPAAPMQREQALRSAAPERDRRARRAGPPTHDGSTRSAGTSNPRARRQASVIVEERHIGRSRAHADAGKPQPSISGRAAKGRHEPDPPKSPREKADVAQIRLVIGDQPQQRLHRAIEQGGMQEVRVVILRQSARDRDARSPRPRRQFRSGSRCENGDRNRDRLHARGDRTVSPSISLRVAAGSLQSMVERRSAAEPMRPTA